MFLQPQHFSTQDIRTFLHIDKEQFLDQINQTENYINRASLRLFLKNYFQNNSIFIREKEIDVLIRGMDCDRFDHYKKDQIAELLFDSNMIEFCHNQTLKEYTNELRPCNEFSSV